MKNKIKVKEMFFFIGLLCIIITSFMRCTRIFKFSDGIIDQIMLQGYIFLIISILLKKENIKLYFMYMVIFIIAFIAYINSKQSLLLTMCILIISSKGIPIKKIVRFTYYISSFVLMIHIGLYIIEYFLDKVSLSFVLRENGLVRHCFLFNHPNTFSSYFTWTVLMRIYLKYNNINYVDYLRLIVYSIFLYYFPNSKTSAIILFLSMILILCTKKIHNIENKIIWKIIKNLTVICFIFSILTIVFYNSGVVNNIDKLFTGRIRLARATYEYYDITLLGQYIPFGQELEYMPEFGLNGLTLDSVYFCLIFCYGIIPTVYVIYLTNKTNRNKKDVRDVVFIAVLSIFGLTESFILNPAFGFPLYFLRENIKLKNGGKKNGENYKSFTNCND